MFKCGKCGTQQQAGVQPVRVVVETRQKQYSMRRDAYKLPPFDDKGGEGWEIAKEVQMGECCVPKKKPEELAAVVS